MLKPNPRPQRYRNNPAPSLLHNHTPCFTMLAKKLARSLNTRSASSPWMRYLNSICSNGSNAGSSIPNSP